MTTVTSGTMRWIGLGISAAVVLVMLADAATGLFAPHLIEPDMIKDGFQTSAMLPVSLVILASAIVYAVPRTAVLGAILITGVWGGAYCTHLRMGEIASPAQLLAIGLGVAAWAGLWFRDARLRALLPLSS
ncbi:MAG: DoxX family protein [Casimicrobiaceae bacterium]